MSAQKLTREQVLEIYNSTESAKTLATRYNVSTATVSYIWSGQRYRSVTKHPDPHKIRAQAFTIPSFPLTKGTGE